MALNSEKNMNSYEAYFTEVTETANQNGFKNINSSLTNLCLRWKNNVLQRVNYQ